MAETENLSGKINQLFQEGKKFCLLQFDLLKLEGVEKLSVLATAFILVLLFLVLGASACFYIFFGIAYLLAPVVGGLPYSLLIVGGFCLLVIVLIYLLRRKLIINPIVNFLSNLFFQDKNPF